MTLINFVKALRKILKNQEISRVRKMEMIEVVVDDQFNKLKKD